MILIFGSHSPVFGYNIENAKDSLSKQGKETVLSNEKNQQGNLFVSVGINNNSGLLLNLSSWRKLSPIFNLGFGLGVEHFISDEITIVPVFIGLRANLSTKDSAPFISLKGGYSLGGGLFVSPELGYKFNIRDKKAFTIQIGFESQRIGTSYYTQKTVNSLGIGIGYMF
ncbi:MAG: hypothetical protein PHS59_09305 [Paludibacter sp.]|nr:hypothetical protein [Paludibacter sp.]